MNELGRTIREALREKNMTSADLAQSIGIKVKAINNIIYGQSKKPAVIRKISAGLGINLLAYVNENQQKLDSEDEEIDLDKYRHATTVITVLIKDEKIHCNQEELNTLIRILYDFIHENSEHDTAIYVAFATGMVKFGLKYLILGKKIEDVINNINDIASE